VEDKEHLPCLWCNYAVKEDGVYYCSKYEPMDEIEDIIDDKTVCASVVPFTWKKREEW
jgi:hypothetical protein